MADLGLRHFFRGGVLVPLDYKLTPAKHGNAQSFRTLLCSITEYPICGNSARRLARVRAECANCAVTKTRKRRSSGAQRWKSFAEAGEPVFIARKRRTGCIVYSSGTGGRPKGCMMTHENYLSRASRSLDLSVLAGRALTSVSFHKHAIVSWWFFRTVYVRRSGRGICHVASEYVREAFPNTK